jgi:hypothetical protein
MKHFCLLQMICFLVVACGSGGADKTPVNGATKSDTNGSVTTETNTNVSAPNKIDTAVFVGAFAEWKKQQGETFDGNYDTVNQVFKLCSKPSAIRVDRNEITLLNSGNCEDKMGTRFALMILNRDSVHIIGNELVSAEFDSSRKVYKTVWATDQGQTEFRLKARDTAHFVNAAKRVSIIGATRRAPTSNAMLRSELRNRVDTTKR